MTKETMTVKMEFTVAAYQDTDGKWQGYVQFGDSDPFVYGIKRSTEEKAIISAKREFHRAIGCSHTMKYGEWQQIGQDHMGNDLYGHIGNCTKCGYHDSFESDE